MLTDNSELPMKSNESSGVENRFKILEVIKNSSAILDFEFANTSFL